MYKIAGELTPCVLHVAARSVAAQGLSIFGDHQDVMAVRQTGWVLLASNNPQEVMDTALIAQAATLQARIPFVHFFDGFRTSHEVAKIEQLTPEDMLAMLPEQLISQHRLRSLSPDRPLLRGTAQNPDVYFQARESVNPYYMAIPSILQGAMDRFAAVVGRQYKLYEYVGAPDAEHVVVLMGSGCDVAQETVENLTAGGAKIGVLKVRLFRPFSAAHFLEALPRSVKSIAVLDRTKEPGSVGEPLYQEVLTALAEVYAAGKLDTMPRIVGGRYGLSSKEFTPAMVKAVFDTLADPAPRNHFTVGINDDVTHSSLIYDPEFSTEHPGTVRALFYGLGADGTVGANKNSIKIIGEDTENYAQGYFVYDSKKSGSVTTSHLRFGPSPIRSSYLISKASFVACHQFNFLERIPVLKYADTNAVFLLNSPFSKDEVWDKLPRPVQQTILDRKLRFYVIDGYTVAKETGMGQRINTIMQTCFFAISGVLPREEAIDAIKKAIKKTYGKRGESVVQQNFAAVDSTLANLHQVTVPAAVTSTEELRPPVPAAAPAFVQEVLAPMIFGSGDDLPVSKLPADGTYPTATAQWEKRNIALEIPDWDADLCIQCGKCVLVCPHAVIRAKLVAGDALASAPESFKSADAKWKNFPGTRYVLQVAPEDCTGCALCIEACPAKSKTVAKHRAINMVPQPEIREREAKNWEFFLTLPEAPREQLSLTQIKDVQLLEPLFEFSGACSGCGETPYIKLLTQLYGDRTIIANATGCSSIYGGNLPTTPYSVNKDGRGVAWSNSLFEDNAEFGLGLRLSVDQNREYARDLLLHMADQLPEQLVGAILKAEQKGEKGLAEQRERIVQLKKLLAYIDSPRARALADVADMLVDKSVWIVGGDGWAYDIGFGGLDHVLASGRNINILVLDTEVYSNTGGQMSKSTPRAAVAKFAAGGKGLPKKDLALIAMSYPAYVARIAMGSSDMQTLKAFNEAEAFNGPSLILAYSHCIAHGYDLVHGLEQQKLAVQSGHWPLFRYNPSLPAGQPNFVLDSKPPSIPLEQYIYNETRYTMLRQAHAAEAKVLLAEAQADVNERWKHYEALARNAAAASTLGAD
jgi:pyruvate-ferredoxin/flavodoxin oxidoreductase